MKPQNWDLLSFVKAAVQLEGTDFLIQGQHVESRGKLTSDWVRDNLDHSQPLTQTVFRFRGTAQTEVLVPGHRSREKALN
jgi:hypothetical protein